MSTSNVKSFGLNAKDFVEGWSTHLETSYEVIEQLPAIGKYTKLKPIGVAIGSIDGVTWYEGPYTSDIISYTSGRQIKLQAGYDFGRNQKFSMDWVTNHAGNTNRVYELGIVGKAIYGLWNLAHSNSYSPTDALLKSISK